ncbi:MAG: acylneuraminate cytidylyltransferase [Bacteroides sp.]|nr:acylneuraminate cytidylyltransferase [Bacteroides sp.]MCM1549034.1 acylneuraminate cytidylyltransferase [Clostridium sp.]
MNVAFIPVRGGSKSIPLKNIKRLNGRPLVYWVIRAACECKYLEQVYVATDSEEIKQAVEGFQNSGESGLFSKVTVIGRSAESASDIASTEFAMLEFAEEYEFDTITLIQATSPLLSGMDLDRGFEAYGEEGVDSVLSVVPQKRFRWQWNSAGNVETINYDVYHRPRRQDFTGDLVENGAFYITSRENLLQSGNRLSGNIRAVEMSEDTFLEIDEPSDWITIEALMKKKGIHAPLLGLSEIRLFLTDCDGCLTDGGMYYSEQGDEMKKFNTRDGMGFQLLREQGILVGIVTSEDRALNQRRAEKLKLDIIEQGCSDKVEVIDKLCRKLQLDWKNVLYIGDDRNDLAVLKKAGISCCPADAIPEARELADYVTQARGGAGVIREIAELLLQNYNK